jgi:hypothetical protein
MKMVRQKCDPKRVKEFDDSRLCADFAKPALINAGVLSARDLARRPADDIAGLQRIGPSAMPVLRAALKKRPLKCRPATHENGSLPRCSPCIRLHSTLL